MNAVVSVRFFIYDSVMSNSSDTVTVESKGDEKDVTDQIATYIDARFDSYIDLTKKMLDEFPRQCEEIVQGIRGQFDEIAQGMRGQFDEIVKECAQETKDRFDQLIDSVKKLEDTYTNGMDEIRRAVDAELAQRDATLADLLLRVQQLEARMPQDPVPVPPVPVPLP
jgi:hypothetical protein